MLFCSELASAIGILLHAGLIVCPIPLIGRQDGRGCPPARFLATRLNAGLQRLLKGHLLMSKILPRENVRSEMLLALAGYWRNCAAQSNEPQRSDMMRGTAEEFERAAAETINQMPATLSP